MTRYRRMPGFRRGFINSSSVWLGGDHLLLVKSARFREDYKRFHLRDIQAIAIAAAPRFHISTRAAVIGLIWLLAFSFDNLISRAGGFSITPYLWGAGCVMVAAWLYISGASSCRCRIYTAVSSDELPSVYRSWTARRFLAAVEPKIAEAQGVIEGEWAEAAETRDIGPALTFVEGPASPAPTQRAPARSTASDLLIGALFASGSETLLTLNASAAATRMPAIGFMLAKLVLAFVIIVQHSRGKLQSGMQRIAVATLLAMGVLMYAEQMVAGFQLGAEAANKRVVTPIVPVLAPGSPFAKELDGGLNLVLGCAGLAVILLSKDTAI